MIWKQEFNELLSQISSDFVSPISGCIQKQGTMQAALLLLFIGFSLVFLFFFNAELYAINKAANIISPRLEKSLFIEALVVHCSLQGTCTHGILPSHIHTPAMSLLAVDIFQFIRKMLRRDPLCSFLRIVLFSSPFFVHI